jgi:hypothetical protein
MGSRWRTSSSLPSFRLGWFWGDLLVEMLGLWDAGRVSVGPTPTTRCPGVVAREVFGTDLEDEVTSRVGGLG